MWRKVRPIIFLSALACCLWWPSVGGCSESRTYQISETELTALQNHLDALQANNAELMSLLNESALDLNKALSSLSESRNELEKLRSELNTLQAETKQLSESLRIANAELQSARESFKASERERDRIESRLRTQRNIWEVLCLVAVGIAAGK